MESKYEVKIKKKKEEVNGLIHFEKHKGIDTASTTIKGDQESLVQILGNIINIFIQNEIIKSNDLISLITFIERGKNNDQSRIRWKTSSDN